MYSYQEALEESVKYFDGDELAAKVFCDKYALHDNDDNILEATPKDMHWRLAKEFARIEKNKFAKPLSEEEIFNLLDRFKYIVPQGSPMYGIGNKYKYISISNCTLAEPPEDSYGSILHTDQQLVQLSKRRCGVGIDVSKLRPLDAPVQNSAKTSTGITSFMERFSNSIREVGQKNRRGALMITCDVTHPEIENFINIKNDDTKVTGANISVKLTDKFLKAVKDDTDFTQQWPIDCETPKITKTVKARDLWKRVIHSAWNRAEPGLLFWDTVKKESIGTCYKNDGFLDNGTNPSLRWNTLVLTNYGILPIKEIAESNFPNLMVKNMYGKWCLAKAFKSGKNKQLFEISFTNRQKVYCTAEHKWPLVMNNTRELVDKRNGKIKKKETKDIKYMDIIYYPYSDNLDFGSNFSYEDGFFVGWNLGDGWISYHKTQQVNQYAFIFSNEDLESGIGDKVLNYSNSLAKIKSHLLQDHDSKAYKFCTTDINVRERMDRLGVKNKKEGLPKTAFTASDDFRKGLIDALFSSDGSIYLSKTKGLPSHAVSISSAHKQLALDIKSLLSFYGISSNLRHSIVKHPNNPRFKKSEYHRYDLKMCGINAVKFAKTFTLTNVKKQQKLEEILSCDVNKYYPHNLKQYLFVKKVKPTEIYEDVYDITVFDETHTFQTECGITGNCSEIPLPPLDSCRLLALNLLSYVEHPFTTKAKFNYVLFTEHSKIAQRLMDDIVDLEAESINKIIGKIKNDPEENDIKTVELTMWKKMLSMCLQGRRTGTGITALGDTLAALGIPYCSDQGIKTTEKIYKTLKLACYRSSVDMAKEIGSFPIWDHNQEKDNPFLLRIKKDDAELYEDMIRYGRRNIALLTTAPTGTVSLLTQTTSGIEPAFMLSYTRRRKINAGDKNVNVNFVDKSGDSWEEYKVYHHTLKKWMEITGETDETKSPWYGSCAEDLNWKDRVRLQAAAAVHIDHSISSTLNLPENVTEQQVAEIYETAWETGVIKGITVYRKNCRTGVLVENKKEEQSSLIKTQATKRPKRLTCDVHHLTVKGVRYFTIVGLIENEPYEIFINRNCNGDGDSIVSRNIIEGHLDKQKQGHYNLIDKDGNHIVDIVSANCEEHEEAIARMTSTALRHGADIHFIVHQLEKTRGDMQSFSKAMARTLKKYIKDGTKVTGEKCPECSSDNIVRIEGCKTCVGCGWSKCS